ncbi:hypothetical protein ACIQZO_39160 [Streptomyces sp. NPDC097617]|uniref:hypothetical protein n=1 Tax=Streptomyces sp. NPDC097617 TaxID=3366091 RepID=UPI003815A51D
MQAFHLNCRSWALNTCDQRYREAIEQADEALEHARRAQDIHQQVSALVNAASAHRQLGQAQTAADRSLAAIDLSEDVGYYQVWPQAMRLYGSSLRLRGRAEEALTQHKRIMAFLDAPDCPVSGHVADIFRAHTTQALGLDCAALGRWREAADHYRSAQIQSSRIGVFHREAEQLLHLGEALIELGETEEARYCLRHGGRQGAEGRTEAPGHAPRRVRSACRRDVLWARVPQGSRRPW